MALRVRQPEVDVLPAVLVLDFVVGVGIEGEVVAAAHADELPHHLLPRLRAALAVAVLAELLHASGFQDEADQFVLQHGQRQLHGVGKQVVDADLLPPARRAFARDGVEGRVQFFRAPLIFSDKLLDIHHIRYKWLDIHIPRQRPRSAPRRRCPA